MKSKKVNKKKKSTDLTSHGGGENSSEGLETIEALRPAIREMEAGKGESLESVMAELRSITLPK